MLAPEVAAGTVLPRVVVPEDFLVAVDEDDRLVGMVGLSWWSSDVIELGSLVSAVRGRGVGGRLVAAVFEVAAQKGARSVVALTALDGWFGRQGFHPRPVAPWALARQAPVLLASDSPWLESAVARKARSSCASCPLLARCRQHLMVRAVAVPARQVA